MITKRSKSLNIRPLDADVESVDLSKISTIFDTETEPVAIQYNSWPDRYSYKPFAQFQVAYYKSDLFLKFSVKESFIRAMTTRNNGPVYQDSCVEIFLKPINSVHYYNFEFNCIGTCLLQVGSSRQERSYAPERVIQLIRRISTLGDQPFSEQEGKFHWDLTIIIPAETLFLDTISSFQDRVMQANFYKCGDLLSQPHYLSWRPIKTKDPDFHRPEYFGTLNFR